MPDKALGYISNLHVHARAVFAIGGTYNVPTLLRSTDDGREFASWQTPRTSGLRDLVLDGDVVTVVGEYGCIARTSNHGERWKRIKAPNAACLYAIARDSTGRFWITGDDGLVLRSKTRSGSTFDRLRTHTKGRVLGIYIDPIDGNPWVLDSTGVLQQWDGKKFVLIELPALRIKTSLNSMTRTPAGTLLVAANGGGILRSTKNGASWKKIPTSVRVDLEAIEVTRYGIVVAGDRGTVLVSHDDGGSFAPIEAGFKGHLWSIANVADGILIGGDEGAIRRIPAQDLARVMHAAYAGRDDVLAALALQIADGDDGTQMVLEDALRERRLW